MTRVLIRLLIGLFPRPMRTSVGLEMLDAFEDRAHNSGHLPLRTLGREVTGLLLGAASAWHSHLGSRAGVRTGLGAGIALWFGFLVGLGPGRRAVSHIFAPGVLSGSGKADPLLIGISVLAVLLLATSRAVDARIAVLMLGGGTVLAAVANMISWDTEVLGLLMYELRWIAPVGVAMMMLRTHTSRRLAIPVFLVVAIAGSTGLGNAFSGRNYDQAISSLPIAIPIALLLVGLVVAVVLPFISPGTASIAMPAMAHLGAIGLLQAVRGQWSGDITDPFLLVIVAWMILASAFRLQRSNSPARIE